MVYPEEIVRTLKSYIDKFNYIGKPEFGRLQPNPIIISPENIAEIIKSCFFASMLTEEGNFLHFRVVYSGRNDFDTLLDYRLDEFAVPAPLDVTTIIKLANTFDYKRSALAIEEENQKLYIKGVLHYGYDLYNYTIKKHSSPLFAQIPEHLIITVNDTGSLNISIGMQTILTYKKGELTESDLKMKIAEPIIGDIISDFFENNVPQSFKKEESLRHYFTGLIDNKIIYFMNTINNFAVGGTVILCENMEDLSISYDIKSQPYSSTTILQLLDSKIGMLEKGEKDAYEVYPEFFQNNLPPTELKLLNYFDTIAYYSRVDGAVVLNRQFDIIGFGAKIVSREKLCDVYSGLNGQKVEADAFKAFMKTKGTRHTSALHFVQSNINSTAFVFSQDQKITVFKNHRDKLFFYRDIHLYMDSM